jgi:hypothetical protein
MRSYNTGGCTFSKTNPKLRFIGIANLSFAGYQILADSNNVDNFLAKGLILAKNCVCTFIAYITQL